MESEILKFHHFPSFPWPVWTLIDNNLEINHYRFLSILIEISISDISNNCRYQKSIFHWWLISITNDGYRLLVYQLTTPGLIYIKTITTKTFFFQEVCIVADHVKQTCKFHAIFYGPPRSAAASKLWNTSSPCLVLGSEVLVSSPRSVQ